jgi:triacylglycerol esterase/lipase EstA (alpha/beta hydrolase family)
MRPTTTRPRLLGVLLALAGILAIATVTAAGASAATPATTTAAGVPDGIADLLPATSPPGANDFTCRPSAAHPAPVVLVHGTFESATDNWATVSPQIKAAGYCVFALDYGDRGTGDIPTSAGQLKRFVDAVLGATGARKVSLVGHSQGGMMPRWYLKFLGGAAKVDDLVGLAPSNHGTTNPGAFVAGATFCPACDQQRAGSSFLQTLNAGDETPGAVSYTSIETRYDEVVTPFTSAFLAPGPNTANILLQDACPGDVVDHQFIPDDRVALRWTLQALGRPGPADPAQPPSCA